MRRWLISLILVIGISGLGFWAWRVFLPSPDKVIRQRLTKLARIVSCPGNEAPLARLANARAVTMFFTPDVEITVDLPGRSRQNFNGRDELLPAAIAARSSGRSFTVKFLDIIVTLDPDRNSAVAELTATAKVPGERDLYVQELKFRLKQVDGEWLIYQVENLKTLSIRNLERRAA